MGLVWMYNDVHPVTQIKEQWKKVKGKTRNQNKKRCVAGHMSAAWKM